jgi:hypothetical protein
MDGQATAQTREKPKMRFTRVSQLGQRHRVTLA